MRPGHRGACGRGLRTQAFIGQDHALGVGHFRIVVEDFSGDGFGKTEGAQEEEPDAHKDQQKGKTAQNGCAFNFGDLEMPVIRPKSVGPSGLSIFEIAHRGLPAPATKSVGPFGPGLL